MKRYSGLIVIVALAGCATGRLDYVPPSSPEPLANSKTINEPRDVVWNASVPELSKQFFVINNLDKSSGLINVSYSGDPESYVDCGFITSHFTNLRGDHTYHFPAAQAQESYQIMNGIYLFLVDRKMSLDGRVNLVFEKTGPAQTKVTAYTRYVLKRHITARNAGNNIPFSRDDSISFNSGGEAAFASNSNGDATTCVPTGKLERDILSAIR